MILPIQIPPTQSVREVLKSKHPSAQPLYVNSLLPSWINPPVIHPVIFDPLDGCVICSAALQTSGAAGPSGVDVHCWRRLCTAFHSASSELCVAIALFARCICTSFISPVILSTIVACCLIALDKNPGVRLMVFVKYCGKGSPLHHQRGYPGCDGSFAVMCRSDGQSRGSYSLST